MLHYSPTMPVMSAKAATGIGNTINVADWQSLLLQFGSASSGSFTVKLQGSFSETCPDFASAASPSNHWAYIGFYDLDTGTFTAGSTGIVLSGTDSMKNLLVNTDGLRWFTANMTARAAGSATISLMGNAPTS